MNLAEIVDPHPEASPALVSRGRTTTYGELREQVGRLRGGLAARGIEAGDRVAIVAGATPNFVISYLAVLGAGAVAVPLNATAPARALTTELVEVGARVALVGPAGQASFAGVDRATVPALEVVVVDDADASALPAGTVGLDDLMTAGPVPVVDRTADDLAVLIFTSGTAGSPRAAMLSHGSLLANLGQLQALEARALRRDDVSYCALPLFHIFGLNVILGLGLYSGSSVLLAERFEPGAAADTVAAEGVTVVAGAPAMWSAWAGLEEPSLRDHFATVRLAASGAAKLPLQVRDAVRDRLDLEVIEGYGLTEASPVVTSALGRGAKAGSIGVPLPGVEVRLVDADGDDVLVGDPGELWVRGPNVFAGYWGDTSATEGALSADGWLRTGDVGVVDDDGDLFLVDRTKDLVIVSGFNVYPAEVEEVLVEHPAVAAAAVVGVVHPHTGEAVKAFVVRARASVDAEELIAHCAASLARYKCPETVVFVDEIPVGLGGKIQRWALR
ncbi:MAG: AMP-binding protein [Acidimicrobiia bacterium]|jgi:long-chain acyl-CoA synthetase|nr:AMP-binding protein [Acidimicrobiia bacterium]